VPKVLRAISIKYLPGYVPVVKLRYVKNLVAYGKTYYKWQVSLPPEIVKELKWKPDDELVPEAVNGVLHLKRKKPQSR
jgi:hypothetical protein